MVSVKLRIFGEKVVKLKFICQEYKKFQLNSRSAYYLKISPVNPTGSKTIMENPESVH
jgi:hypothetical protein